MSMHIGSLIKFKSDSKWLAQQTRPLGAQGERYHCTASGSWASRLAGSCAHRERTPHHAHLSAVPRGARCCISTQLSGDAAAAPGLWTTPSEAERFVQK